MVNIYIPAEVYERIHPSLIDVIEAAKINENILSIGYSEASKDDADINTPETINIYYLNGSKIYQLETGKLLMTFH